LTQKRGPERRFAEVLEALKGAGLESAWHAHRGEEHGKESSTTRYWRWSEASRFHIAFVFYSAKSVHVAKKERGSFGQYVAGTLSDHVPLVVDFH
jgi:exodeoxyribonuclease III